MSNTLFTTPLKEEKVLPKIGDGVWFQWGDDHFETTITKVNDKFTYAKVTKGLPQFKNIRFMNPVVRFKTANLYRRWDGNKNDVYYVEK